MNKVIITNFFIFPVKLLLVHGYFALFIWSVLESEIGLMLSGWLASKHIVFEYEKVILVAVTGAFMGDLITFGSGKLFQKRAQNWLNKHPKKAKIVKNFIKNWGALVIIFERFIYGTHIPTLLTLSMSGYPFLKFLLFDIIGVILWAFTFVSIGYFLGRHAVEIVVLIQRNFVVIFFILFMIFIIGLIKKS